MKVSFLVLLGASAAYAAGLELNQGALLGANQFDFSNLNLAGGSFGGFGGSGWSSASFQQPLLSTSFQQPLLATSFQQPLLSTSYQQPLLGSSFGGFGGFGGYGASNLNQWNLGASFQQPLMATTYQQPIVQAAAFSATKQAPVMTSTTIQQQPIVQQPIYEQRPTITNPAQGAFSAPLARADMVNAAIVRPTTALTMPAQVESTNGAAAVVAPGSLQQQAIVQQPIYEQLPTVTNAMQGTKSQPLARAAIMNAAIVRPATQITNAAIVDSSVGAAPLVAPGSLQQQPIVQQPIYEQRPTITNPAQGAFSAPLARPNMVNAAIIRPTTTLNMPAQVESSNIQAPLLQAGIGSSKSHGF